MCNRTSWISFSVFRNFILFHSVRSVGLFFSTRPCSCLHDLMFCCHWALLSETCNKLQNLSWPWNGRDRTAFCCRKQWPYLMLCCYAMGLFSSHPPTCARYMTLGPSCDPDTRPDRRGLMHQPQVRWEVWHYSIIKRLCVSAFFLLVSVGSTACLVTVGNVIGDCLGTETIAGIRGQALERWEGADSHGWRACYHGLKCLSFS